MKCLIATQNPGKVKEFARLLGDRWQLQSLAQAGVDLQVEETGSTFIENAILKAQATCQATGMAALADDSGLCVPILGGQPGIYSARYSGQHGDDAANRRLLLERLQPYPAVQQRTAYFACALALARPGKPVVTAEGRVYGHIGFREEGDNGFGYDSIFVFRGQTFASMLPQDKNAVSHRADAAARLLKALEQEGL